MPTKEYASQAEMDDDFEKIMEREEGKTRLRELIASIKWDIESTKCELHDHKQSLIEAENELLALDT